MANKWVDETVRCFITDAADIEPTNPVNAIERHFERNATEELKAKCADEKKTAATCWRFIEAVARAALHGKSGHIDPGVVYAVAMHYFQDVPKDWNDAKEPEDDKPVKTEADGNSDNATAEDKPDRPEKPKKKTKAKAKNSPKGGASQGFFFDVFEDGGNNGEDGEENGDAE